MTIAFVSTQQPREALPADACLCDYCTAKCCKYYALPIDEPKTRKDFDFLRWFLLHGETSVFLDEGSLYLIVHTQCKHLQDDNRCGIYETRPEICREYSTSDCEYSDDWVYERYFETAEQVEEYAEAILPPKDRQSIRSPRPALLPILG